MHGLDLASSARSAPKVVGDRPAAAGRGIRAVVVRAFAYELDRGRVGLWLPVLFAAGIALYFALPIETPKEQSATP